MAIVATLFVVGGNTEKLLCEPLANRQLFKVPGSNSHPPTSSPTFPLDVFVLARGVFCFFVSRYIIDKPVALCLRNEHVRALCVCLQIIDTPYLVHPAKKNFLPGMLFQNPNIDLTIGSMYR